MRVAAKAARCRLCHWRQPHSWAGGHRQACSLLGAHEGLTSVDTSGGVCTLHSTRQAGVGNSCKAPHTLLQQSCHKVDPSVATFNARFVNPITPHAASLLLPHPRNAAKEGLHVLAQHHVAGGGGGGQGARQLWLV